MASLQLEPTGTFHIVCRIDGKRYKRSLRTKVESTAVARRDEIQETINLLRRGRISLPDGAAVIDFVMADGKTDPKPKQAPVQADTKAETPSVPAITLKDLFDKFFDTMPAGTLEESTMKTMRLHQRHLIRVFKARFKIQQLTKQDLQRYINKRATETTQYIVDKSAPKAKQQRTPVSAATIRKEIVTLGTVWRWAETEPLVTGTFPNRGLRLPKTDEKPPFQTWEEIERQINCDSITGSDAEALWGCLYLRSLQVEELLQHVKSQSQLACVYPMFAVAAYTGARRSELLRSRKSDFDFVTHFFTARERKRVRGQRTTRRVPMTPQLEKVMKDCFEIDPDAPPSGSLQWICSARRAGRTGGPALSIYVA
ncbi:MAG: tyrosine-type recombinase/integrase [Rubripirellula sp.]